MTIKKMPWFRMYTDFLNDPKMISLAFEDQRHFIGVLALKSDGAIDDVCEENLLNRIVAQRLWIDHGIIRDVKKRLLDAHLIDANWQPVAWDKRQFVSDKDSTAAERKRRERAAKAVTSNVTDVSRVTHRDSHGNSHAVVTRLDTDTDTEKEANASVASLRLPTCPTQSIVNLYQETLPELPAVRLLSDKRKRVISSFWKFVLTSKRSDGTVRATDAESAIAWVRVYFERARNNDFLMGRGKKADGHEGWVCDIDFLMSDKGRTHVIEKTKDAAS